MVSFTVGADAYDRFMGRYSVLLAPQLADSGAVAAGQRALNVGCGPSALAAELVRRLAAALDTKRQSPLRELCRELLPAAPFVLTAWAWAARGSA